MERKIVGEDLLEKMTGRSYWLGDYTDNKINGKKYCVQCGTDLSGRKIRYCDDACNLKFWNQYKVLFSWDYIRTATLKRDQYTCKECGRKASQFSLEVHHIIPRNEGGTDDMKNLVTLCIECHKKETKIYVQQLFRKKPIHVTVPNRKLTDFF